MPDRQRGQTEYGENLANLLAMHARTAARSAAAPARRTANEDTVRDFYLGPDASITASNKVV
jgi:hypothetical protein